MLITKKEIKRRITLENENTKYCGKCHQIKPLFEFAVHSTGRKLSAYMCLDCDNARKYERYYNMTLKEYRKLLKQQNSRCAICGTIVPGGKDNIFHVDHDHKIKNKRNSVRGLLCQNCNHGLGNFKDNPEALAAAAAAAAYLLRAENRKKPLLGEKE